MPQHNHLWGADQASGLRAVAQHDASQATTIAITSGKGGVGKSNIAVNLGVALAMRGLRITLMDLDLGLANVDVLLNIDNARNLSHVVTGACSIEDITTEGPAGLRIVPGASGLEELANLSEFERHRLLLELREVEAGSDYLILDLGAGVGRNVVSFARHSDLAIVITTPEPTALADAYATVKMLARSERTAEIELLVNLAESRAEARRTYERIAGVAARFLGVPVTLAGYVLTDDAVVNAVRSRRPFLLTAPGSNASACVRALAKRYVKQNQLPMKEEGFFSRVAAMFR